MGKDFDSRCFKCVQEMQGNGKGLGAGILAGKMQQGLVGQDPDAIFVCSRHK